MSESNPTPEQKHSLIREIERLGAELVDIQARLRAIYEEPDDDWTGWRAAIEPLIEGSPASLREVAGRLKNAGMDALADRMVGLADEDPRD